MQFPQSKQEESTEEEEIKQQQRIVIMKDLIEKIRSKRRMDAKRRLWVSLQKYREGWDATDGRNGRAQRTFWEIVMELEKFRVLSTLVVDLAKALERVSLLVVWAWATHFCFLQKILRVFLGILSTRSECSSNDVWRSRSKPSWPLYQNPSGIACFCVVYCKMH